MNICTPLHIFWFLGAEDIRHEADKKETGKPAAQAPPRKAAGAQTSSPSAAFTARERAMNGELWRQWHYRLATITHPYILFFSVNG
jgi:hypothetical protein